MGSSGSNSDLQFFHWNTLQAAFHHLHLLIFLVCPPGFPTVHFDTSGGEPQGFPELPPGALALALGPQERQVPSRSWGTSCVCGSFRKQHLHCKDKKMDKKGKAPFISFKAAPEKEDRSEQSRSVSYLAHQYNFTIIVIGI